MKVTIVDMQPIMPAIGGGRLRLLGLYHGLGEGIEATYVGSYDWPGEKFRDAMASPTLREVCVPLSPAHHEAAARLSNNMGGKTVIDAAFSQQAMLSPAWISAARGHIRHADAVVISHPWAYTPLAGSIRPDQLVVYDAHNVESLLKFKLLGTEPLAQPLVREVIRNEKALCERADLILCCSHEDASNFTRLFGTPASKMRIVPNGTFTDLPVPDRYAAKTNVAQAFGIDSHARVAVFVGSDYAPNGEAANLINQNIAPQLPNVTFVIVGGAGSLLEGRVAPNVVATGIVDAAMRDDLLAAADLAVNPMLSGSGTNIKMFDFLGANLPVVTTVVGARGICESESAPPFIRIASMDDFSGQIKTILADSARNDGLESPRDYVSRLFSWERISAHLGELLRHRLECGPSFARRALMFSTWNVRCGIAEHAAYLCEALGAHGTEVTVVANKLQGHQQGGLLHEMMLPVTRAWAWDTTHWKYSGLDKSLLFPAVWEGAEFAIIQHHSAFMPHDQFRLLVKLLKAEGLSVAMEFHDSRNLSLEQVEELSADTDHLIFHASDEVERLGTLARSISTILPLPIRSLPEGKATGTGDVFVVGGFGFLRPYKGILTALRAVALLVKDIPGIRYRGFHAIYDDESRAYWQICMQEIERLGIGDRVSIRTDFMPIEEVSAGLAGTDIVMLPYEPSEEGASAAANLAMASGRPMLVSGARIFDPIHSVAVRPAGETPEDYANEIRELYASTDLRLALGEKSRAWAEQHSYMAASGSFHEMLVKPNSVH